VARKVAEGQLVQQKITKTNLHKFLGQPKRLAEEELETNEIGISTGLAWTQVGGEILYIEATLMPGKGVLALTGSLGDVMKESAQAALSYVRSRADHLGISHSLFEKNDIHIHVPAGAIPKDGPSAGITIATALISALTKRPTLKEYAMTGEITLRGRVLPIGGLKEKALAALRNNIKKIIVPDRNQKDLDDIPENIRKKITFTFVKHVDDVIDIAIAKPDKARAKKKTARKKTASAGAAKKSAVPRKKAAQRSR
jgi:ATP-dependent Lon protease